MSLFLEVKTVLVREWWWDDDVLLDQFSGKTSGPLTDDNVVVAHQCSVTQAAAAGDRPQRGGVGWLDRVDMLSSASHSSKSQQ